MYKVTENKLAKGFQKINKQVFDGLLDLSDIDSIEIDFLDTEWGYCVDEDGEIVLGMTDEFPSSVAFLDTLCHEMIHLYQIMSGWKVNHGKQFKALAKHAEKFGYFVD
jgi:hypothetical protein